jgi:Ca-activated chloride channel family protein
LRPGARTALVAYAGDAHVVLPLTGDARILTTYVDALQTDLMPVAGRKPAAALAVAEDLLSRESIPGSILFVTDGFPAAELPTFATRAKAGGNGILALAIGTPEGGPIRTGPARYALTAGGQRVIARMDPAELEALAGATEATLVRSTPDHGDVERIQRNVQTRLEQAIEASAQTRWRDAGYYLTLPVLVLVAFGFRRGWTVRW